MVMDNSYEGFGGGTYGALDNGDNPHNGGVPGSGGYVVAQNGNLYGQGGDPNNIWSDTAINRDARISGTDIPSKSYNEPPNYSRGWAETISSGIGRGIGMGTGIPGAPLVGDKAGGFLGTTIYDTDWAPGSVTRGTTTTPWPGTRPSVTNAAMTVT
jgi:hypothetical protein